MFNKRSFSKLRVTALLALVLLFVAVGVASAADTTETVNPADFSTTQFATDWHIAFTAGTPTSGIVTGPATPPLGTGSLQMTTGAGVDKRYIMNYDHAGVELSDITTLGYSTYGNSTTLAVVLQLRIDPDGAGAGVPKAGGGTTNFSTLNFEPYLSGSVASGSWQTWDVLTGGAAVWGSSIAGDPGNANNGVMSNPATWAEFNTIYPDAVIVDGLVVNVGSGWTTPFTGHVDALKIGYGGNTVTYDFEPAVACTTDCYADAVNGNDLNGGTSAADAKKTIQAAVNAVSANGTVHVLPGTYAENVTIPKSLTLTGSGEGANPAVDTILEGTGLSGSGIYINDNVINVTVEQLRVQNYNTATPAAGVYANLSNNGLTVQHVTSVNNGVAGNNGGGVYLNGPVDDVLIDNVTATNNRTRGIVIWNGFKTNITITNNTVTGNNCCGIELQDGTASGVTVTGNTVTGNLDSGMAFTGLMAGVGPNVIASNTLTNNGRFGIEIKLPNGTGLATGNGSIVIEDNNISLNPVGTLGPTEERDIAGIAVFRRGWVSGNNNVDIPTGVIVRDNTVSGYQQNNASSDSTGFGIVVEGTNMHVTGNTLTNNDVGVQVQAGHTPYVANTNTDGNQVELADNYFGRGNSPVGCAAISGNTFSGNTVDTRNVNAGGGIVTNVDTAETFCSIQAAIDDAQTLNGHTIQVSAGTYAENVTVSKKITLDGTGSGSNPAVDTLIDPVTGRGIMITASGVSAVDRLVIKDLRVTGAPDDGISLEVSGGSYLTLDNVASVGNPGASTDGFEVKHLNLVTDVKIVNSTLSGNGLSGFRMGTGTKLDGLTVENTIFDGNQYGVNIFAANPAPTFDHITFTDVTITNNTQKGIYTERLNNASFSGLVVTGNGSAAAAFMAGVDINLKYANFTNITIEDSTFEDNGLGDTGNTGVDLTIKVRNDGSYTASPATLTNLDVNHVTFGGTADIAMSVGNNLDQATTTINRNAFGGANTAGLVVFGTQPTTVIDAQCNWWDAADGPSGVGSGSGNSVTANADFTPWLLSDDLDGDCYTPGTITVVKQTTPDGDTTEFEFNPSWSATNFMLADGDSEVSPALNPNDGPFSVAEVNLPPFWSLDNAECTNGSTTADPSSIPLADGESWTCTFENSYNPPPPALIYVSPNMKNGVVDGVVYNDQDILVNTLGTSDWEMFFDGSTFGISKNLTDFTFDAAGCLLMTFNGNQKLSGVTYTPQDVAKFCPTVPNNYTAGTFSMFFDGSDVGLSGSAEIIDALEILPDGRLVVSTKGNTKVPGTVVMNLKAQKNDLLVFNDVSYGPATAGTWELYFNNTDVTGMVTENIISSYINGTDTYVTFWANFSVGDETGDYNDIVVIHDDNTVDVFWDADDWGFSGRIHGLHMFLNP